MERKPSQKRIDALKQLTTAKKMLTDGQVELGRTQEKIKRATELINDSADVLRATWERKRV